MRSRILGRITKIGICSLLAISGFHLETLQMFAAEDYQQEYVQKFPNEIEMENNDGNNMLILDSLGTFDDNFTFEADMKLNNADEEQSAALIFGIKDEVTEGNGIQDENAIRVNIHNKIGDWGAPARAWGYGFGNDIPWCEGGKGPNSDWLSSKGIDVTETVHMKIQVENKELTYTLHNPGKEAVTIGSATLNESYIGGRLGLMTYKSHAVFSNIMVNDAPYGTVSNEGNGIAIRGLSGDSHAVNEGQGMIKAFSYEADVEMSAGNSAALTFGIQNKDVPGENWFAANFDGQRARVFHVEAGQDTKDFGETQLSALDINKTIHMKLDVDSEGNFKFYLSNRETVADEPVISGTLDKYTGGYLGALTFNSSASFTNIILKKQAFGLTDFTNVGAGSTIKDDEKKSIELAGAMGDHFALYNGLNKKANDFKLQADIDLKEGRSAALVFGIENKTVPGNKWYGANFDKQWGNPDGVMRVFGAGADIAGSAIAEGMTFDKPVHLCIDVKKNGEFTYTFGNPDGSMKTISGEIPNWSGGYIGLLTFDSTAVFSNIEFNDRTDYTVTENEVEVTDNYKTNLEKLSFANGTWEVRQDGLYSNAVGKGDSFLYTKSEGKNFVYSTDVKFHKQDGASALLFRSTNDKDNKNCYAANIDGGSGSYKLWRWQDDSDYQLIDSRKVDKKESYHLSVVAYNGWLSYYLDGQLVGNTGDYTMQNVDLGQSTILEHGFFGLLNFNSEVSFQNTYFKEFNDSFTPLLEDLRVTSTKGSVEEPGQFINTESVYMQYVSNDAETVNIAASAKSSAARLQAVSEDGSVYSDLQNIPVKVGKNVITLTSAVEEDGHKAALTYRILIVRRKASSSYYNEEYRGQYHYSVKEGWANDPNGLVYYKGKYHMFYQFYSDTTWGPMHWAHATSTDLIHWEEQPIAFYPDENGSMFSGCIVVDDKNTSGLFEEGSGGLVALITANGNGQRIKLAYSTDEGKTWTKTNKIAADWTTDSLNNRDFRDPKVFRWENKWFMVIAGGPLRIYSSTNLKEWKEESAYADLHTECPDLYPVQAADGTLKWVLSRGGRYYKIGDFKEVDGKWTFVADSQYEGNDTKHDGIMNFGKDSYAAMTYYQQDFGTSENPTIPQLVELNWMNTWDYCRDVAKLTGNDTFNGTFNLNLTLGLDKAGDKYVLTQKPITAYENLRSEAVIDLKDVEVTEHNGLLKDFKGDSYEIVAQLKPGKQTTRTGFKVRTGNGQETVISYDVAAKKLSIDRTKSGTILNDKFREIDAQSVAKENADGSIDLHIFVDKSSVEVFMNNYTTAGANQIFPTPTSLGAEIFSEGDISKADIKIYPLRSIWTKEAITDIQKVGIDKTAVNAYVDDTFALTSYVMPVNVAQDIIWSLDDPSVLEMKVNGGQAEFTARKKGNVIITAASKAAPDKKAQCRVTVRENALKTNLKGFQTTANGWYIDGENYIGSIGADNGFTLAETKARTDAYTYSADIKLTKGIFNMILEAEPNAFAGSYAVQLHAGQNKVRLFDFREDKTFTEAQIKTPSDTGEYRLEIIKDANMIIVRINAEEVCRYVVEEADRQYTEGLFGFGIYDAEVEVSNIYVRDGYPTVKILSQVKDLQLLDTQSRADAEKLLPVKVRVEGANGVEKAQEEITWNLDKVRFNVPGSYSIIGTIQTGLQLEAKVRITTDKSDLQSELEKAKKIERKGYTDSSWKTFEKALETAKEVLAKEYARAGEVRTAVKELQAAISGLEKEDITIRDKADVIQITGSLPDGLVLRADEITDQIHSILNADAKTVFDVHKAFDIRLLHGDASYQPEGHVLLRLKLDASLYDKKVFIAYINEEGEIEVRKTVMKDGYAQAEVTHFSIYALVTYKEQSYEDTNPKDPVVNHPEGTENSNPQKPEAGKADQEMSESKVTAADTGDSTNLAGYALVFLLSGITLFLWGKRKKQN